MNSTVGPSFKVFFNKVLVGPMNSARDPLKKQKNAFLFLHRTHSARSQKKKKKKAKTQMLPLSSISKRILRRAIEYFTCQKL